MSHANDGERRTVDQIEADIIDLMSQAREGSPAFLMRREINFLLGRIESLKGENKGLRVVVEAAEAVLMKQTNLTLWYERKTTRLQDAIGQVLLGGDLNKLDTKRLRDAMAAEPTPPPGEKGA